MPQMSIDQAMELAERQRLDGKVAEAEDICRKVLALSPENTFVLNRLGICLGDLKRLDEARQMFSRAIEINPNFLDAWANLSLASEKMEDWDAAITARRKAIELRPDSAEYWHRLGTCLGKKGDYEDALEALGKSRELDPEDAGTFHDLIMALCGKREFAEADRLLFARIAHDGKAKSETVRVLADSLKNEGRFEEATELWQRTIDADPGCHEARGQLAMCRITLGDYERGWALYESRWDCDSFDDNVRRDVNRQWGHEKVGKPDVEGKTILLYSEQGIGDTIQFARYAAEFARRGARVIVHCPWPVKLLLQRCNGVRLAYGLTDAVPSYDWHIPMLSLPHAFGTTMDTIPTEIPYVKADEARKRSWAKRIEKATPAGTKLRVGLAWAGNPKHKNDANRSIHPELLEPLADVEGVAYFSLQKSNQNEKAAILPKRPKLMDFTGSLCDFAETAGMIEHLDLVICADTAVAHLAGAMRKEVWLLVPFVPDFRWGLKGERSAWYPTMRIFRQERLKAWEEVVARVVSALAERKILGSVGKT